MMRPKLMAVLIAGLLGTVQAGPAMADGVSYLIVFKDGTFTPSRLEVPSGGSIKIVLRNAGKTPVEFESRSLRKEKVLGAGVESFVVLRGPSKGDYDFFDDFHPDAGKGVIAVK